MYRLRLLRFLVIRWNLWAIKRRKRNPQLRLSNVPGGNGIHIMINEDYLFPPHLLGGPKPEKQDGHWRGTFLKHPFVLYDGRKTQLVDRLGLYRLGQYWIHVNGRVKGNEICAIDESPQGKAEPVAISKVRGPKILIRANHPVRAGS